VVGLLEPSTSDLPQLAQLLVTRTAPVDQQETRLVERVNDDRRVEAVDGDDRERWAQRSGALTQELDDDSWSSTYGSWRWTTSSACLALDFARMLSASTNTENAIAE